MATELFRVCDRCGTRQQVALPQHPHRDPDVAWYTMQFVKHEAGARPEFEKDLCPPCFRIVERFAATEAQQ